MTIAVLDYGSGNLRSVAHALERVGADVVVTGDHGAVMGSNGLVVPGVGHFGACMTAIRERSHDATIKDFIATGRPMFGVCVGMQVLFDGSEEAPEVSGLGVFDAGRSDGSRATCDGPAHGMEHGRLGRTPDAASTRTSPGVPTPWMYFAHSYFAPLGPRRGRVDVVRPALIVTRPRSRRTTCSRRSSTPRSRVRRGLALYRAFVEDAER